MSQTGAQQMSVLDASLLTMDSAIQIQIASDFWDTSNRRYPLNRAGETLGSFYSYYHQKCVHSLHEGGRYIALRTHQDVTNVVNQLKAGASRKDIQQSLRSKMTRSHENEDDLLDNSINLAASLLLMIDFGSLSFGHSGGTEVPWTAGPLRQHLADYFGDCSVLPYEGLKLEKNFIAPNLGRIAGVEIVWTDNLVDHLRLTDDDKKIHIFHHASFLQYQSQSTESLLPTGLATETLQTLALLFPSTHNDTRKWFGKQSVSLPNLDMRAIRCGRLTTDGRQLGGFHFWRDRLITLKQVFDEAQPATISQWWYDRRNGVQWYTFWVAVMVLVLTIFFGLVQSVEGGLQVYASFKSLPDAR